MVERVVVGPWKTNCYIYSSTKKECIVIDPGGSESEIASRVDVLNMVPVGIVLTHGHVDHLAALGKLRDSYAARGYSLPIAINAADRRFLGTGGRETHREDLEFIGLDEMSFFGVDADELPKADVRLKEGDRVFNMDLVVLETPGHTPGSVCLYAEKEGILFSGDTIFFDGVGRTDLPGGSEKKLRESIEKKIALLPPETRIFPGHGPFTTVEREKRGNAYFKGLLQEVRPLIPQRPPLTAPALLEPARPTVARPAAAVKNVKKRKAPRRAPAGKKPPQKKPVKKARAAKPVQKKKAAAARAGKAPARGPRPPKPRSAAARVRKPSGGKHGSSHATRSTKAPGSGRTPAR
jgi:hydroxyacylglutathione hydrolase